LYQDDIVTITRATLVKISSNSVTLVLDSLLSLLEDLARPFKTASSHPPHVLLSELYTLELIADCCSSHWQPVGKRATQSGSAHIPVGDGRSFTGPERRAPEPLHEVLVSRMFEVVKQLFDPIPDGYTLSAKTILDESSFNNNAGQSVDDSNRTAHHSSSGEALESARLLPAHATSIESQVKTIVEFVTASSWSHAFDYFRNALYAARASAPAQGAPVPSEATIEDERSALIVLRLVSAFWVDGQKLSLVIQELCSSFLHFRKSFQNAVAIVTPLLITRWVDRFPAEFVQLHTLHKRRDNSPDTLFDMTQTIVDNGKRRALLYPLQMTLLFLLPEVFEVASNLREAKSNNLAKKVAFLENLRKALRNRNEQAAYCLVSLLRAARHLDAEGDSALLSYAMDVQDEVREAVFRRYSPGAPDSILFEQDVMTAAFVSLAHLNFDIAVNSIAQSCLAPSAPQSFKISIIQACSHFARLPGRERYQPLFKAVSAFIQGQLKVMTSTTPFR
jgi:neurofibromin 1